MRCGGTPWIFGSLCVVLAAAGLWRDAACEDAPPTPRLWVTGDLRGNLEPCGCEAGQFGGLARRAAYLTSHRRDGDLLIELGDLGGGTNELHALGWRAAFRALTAMKYDVFVPGGTDLAFLDDLRRATSDASDRATGPAIVCANLVQAATGEPVFPRWTVGTLPGGRRVAIVGLTSEHQPVPAGLKVTPVLAAAKTALDDLAGKADRVILAGWIEGQPALDLAKSLPAATLVAASRVPKGADEVLRRGGSPTLLAGERGQYVFELTMDALGEPTRGVQRWLAADMTPDPSMAALVERWKMELRDRGEAARTAAAQKLIEEGRVGSAVCAECHAAAHGSWAASKHANAVAALAAKGEDRNALCLQCHDRDIPPAGDAQAAARGVGCEPCHGAGDRHVRAHRPGGRPSSFTAMGSVPESTCRSCHDSENSRDFEFKRYRERILEHAGASKPPAVK